MKMVMRERKAKERIASSFHGASPSIYAHPASMIIGEGQRQQQHHWTWGKCPYIYPHWLAV